MIYRRAFHPAYVAEVPYAVALVELDEGARMLFRIVDCPPETLTIGAHGEIRFMRLTDEVTLPVFAPHPQH